MGDGATLEYTEILRGRLAREGGSEDAFWCQVEVRIPDLSVLHDAQAVSATVSGGLVEWSYLGAGAKITGGSVDLFQPPSNPGEPTTIAYHFTFVSKDTEYAFHGEKHLTSGTRFDAPRDLCELQAAIDDARGLHATGVLSCQLDELIHAYEAATIQGQPSAADASAGLDLFHQFLNRRLSTVFPHIQAQLAADNKFTDEMRRTLSVLAEVLLPSPLPANGPAISDVVAGIAGFLESASGTEVKRIRTLLQIIGIFIPILELDPDKIRDIAGSILAKEEDSLIREAVAGIHQIVVFAYYADTHADQLIGYARPVHRPMHHTHFPVTAAVPGRVFDVVIAGTGPAGALLADRLSSRGKSVLLLEAGPYIPEDEITTGELHSIARLYKCSGLQAAIKPSSVTVLQGACVGGGGVVNNGIFFPLPTTTLHTWQNAGFPFSAETLGQAYRVVATDLAIGDVADKALYLNPAGSFLETKFGKAQCPPLDGPVPPGYYRMLVNLETRVGDGEDVGCRSTGLCNLGCGSERKVNSFQHYLANALNSSRHVTLVPNAFVTRAVMGSGRAGRRVVALEVRLADGSMVRANGQDFVLCCGPVASSGVLLRSDDLLDAAVPDLPIGRRFCGNIASPVFGIAPFAVNPHPSVQMAQLYVPDQGDDGFLIETWFSPPGGIALAMPGFLQVHAERMGLYSRLMCASPVIGTQPTGTITLSGEDTVIDLKVAAIDLDRFRRGLTLVATALLAGGATAIVRLGNGRVITTEDDVDRLDKELKGVTPDDLFLLPTSTAHPQGGNAMSDSADLGVVGADFRLRGIENLRVCDGSVFPAVASVNPQWTIFALAHLCAAGM